MVRLHAAALTALLVFVTACASPISGTPTWPGATLERLVLSADDFPPGVLYERILRDPAAPDGAGAVAPTMASEPAGCADGLTRDIGETAERGPGSAAEYVAAYDGAQIAMTVLSWQLDLDRLAGTAQRCAQYRVFFDTSDTGTEISTTRIASPRADALAYQQTMNPQHDSVFMYFENIGGRAVFGVVFPVADAAVPVQATLPQTFLDVATAQAARLETY